MKDFFVYYRQCLTMWAASTTVLLTGLPFSLGFAGAKDTLARWLTTNSGFRCASVSSFTLTPSKYRKIIKKTQNLIFYVQVI